VPVSLRHRLLDFTHAGPTAAHLSATRMIKQLKPQYYWPRLNRDVKLWYKQCAQCTQSTGTPLRPHGHLQKIQVGAPFDFVTMDILSGFPTASDGSKYILVMVDGFTKWLEAYSLPDQEASTCITAVYNGFFSRFGLPGQLHSNQLRNFKASLAKELCNITDIYMYKTRTGPFHPRSDGLTERANRTILQMLRTTTQQHPNDWSTRLPSLLSAYRMTDHSVTGITPNFAMLGREVLCPCTLIAAPPQATPMFTTYNDKFQETLRDAHQSGRDSLGARARTEKRYFDKRVKPVKLYLGQSVWLYPRPLIRQARRKLVNLWSGPWTITRFCSSIMVKVQHTVTHRRQIVHVDRLMPCEIQSQPESQTVELGSLVKY